jgi:hypothetical protein
MTRAGQFRINTAPLSNGASLAAVNAATTVDCEGAASALVQVLSATSLTGCTLVFEGRMSGGSTPWIVLNAVATNGTSKTTAIAVTPTLTGVPTNGWIVSLHGCVEFRVRVSAITTGSLTVGIRITDVPHG